ncbi:hypothetical protein ACFWCQ_13155 [Streptomyces cyaneofuscatus]|uniref:hypothetical protein n=1 Tax=Streptomyces cyaneofuscatus TaxID=66883 RepID=UPI003648FE24
MLDYPGITDYGALDGARARHCAKFWAPPSTPNPTTTPPLSCSPSSGCPHGNTPKSSKRPPPPQAFRNASGRPVKVSTDQAVDLVQQTAKGPDVRDIAAALATWTP